MWRRGDRGFDFFVLVLPSSSLFKYYLSHMQLHGAECTLRYVHILGARPLMENQLPGLLSLGFK